MRGVPARVPLTFALGLDADAVHKKVLKSGTAQFSPTNFSRLSINPVICLKGNPNSTLMVRQACIATSL